MRCSTETFGLVLLVTLAAGCGADNGSEAAPEEQAQGGAAGTGGSVPTGGIKDGGAAPGTGGKTGTGGATGSGGGTGSGGSVSTGGSAATGGSVGSGGTPHVVTACPAGDGGPGAVGVWENITPPQTPLSNSLGTLSSAVNPQDPATVYVSVTVNQWQPGAGIYKSTDCGATWAKANTGKNASMVDSGNNWQVLIDPDDPEIVYAINGYGGPPSLLKSTDGGTDWEPTFPDGGDIAKAIGGNFTQAVSMDPSNPKHLLVTFHFNCGGAYAPMCMAESKDSGDTWRIFKGPASGWEEGANPIILDEKRWLYSAGDLEYTSDSGATWEKVGSGGSGNLYRAQNGKVYLGSNGGISVSSDGHQWTKIPNSPRATGLVGDGQNLFAVFQNDFSGHPYYTAAENDPTTWTNVSTPQIKAGASFLSYDNDHHILYAPSWGGGLWRVVTR